MQFRTQTFFALISLSVTALNTTPSITVGRPAAIAAAAIAGVVARIASGGGVGICAHVGRSADGGNDEDGKAGASWICDSSDCHPSRLMLIQYSHPALSAGISIVV